jgi:isopentenyl-diphosphate delta-isomerase
MDDSRELVILVDEGDRAIGSGAKLEVHGRGALHRAFSVIIRDRDGRLLLQRRHRSKYHSGGLWTNACCGHPRPGEDVAAAAERRLEEEMGFQTALSLLGTHHYRAELDHGMIENELVHIFAGTYDGAVRPDPTEVDGFEWRALEDIRAALSKAPDDYSVWFRRYADEKWPLAQ